MPDDRELELGWLAVEWELLTESQLESCLPAPKMNACRLTVSPTLGTGSPRLSTTRPSINSCRFPGAKRKTTPAEPARTPGCTVIPVVP